MHGRYQGHHGVKELLTAILCCRKQLDLSHSFAILSKFKAGKPGGKCGSALLFRRALSQFSGSHIYGIASGVFREKTKGRHASKVHGKQGVAGTTPGPAAERHFGVWA